MSRAQSRLIDAGDARLHVRCEGSGPAVVLLHGFTGSVESMEEVARRLRVRHRVVRVDLLGHGSSDAPEDLAPYRMDRCAAQLARVAQALRLGAAHWLGYSMGGRVALALAAWHPERVRSLCLVGASAGLADAGERALRARADEELAEAIGRDGLERFVERWMALPLFASQARLGTAALAEARAQRLRNRPHGLANSLRAMGSGVQPPLHAALPGLRAPVALVVGEEDPKFRALAGEIARTLPDARVLVVAEAGHAAHLEQPDAFAALALRFFAETEARTRRRAALPATRGPAAER
jgi:2-succinyl-6-hydroxy-2,4-cyclohexadiene-1-carboxylate synthase